FCRLRECDAALDKRKTEPDDDDGDGYDLNRGANGLNHMLKVGHAVSISVGPWSVGPRLVLASVRTLPVCRPNVASIWIDCVFCDQPGNSGSIELGAHRLTDIGEYQPGTLAGDLVIELSQCCRRRVIHVVNRGHVHAQPVDLGRADSEKVHHFREEL